MKLQRKPLFSLMLALSLMVLCVLAQAAEVESSFTTKALDIVVVVDQSSSMTDKRGVANPSDKNGYRTEAANMIAAMAAGDGSRVAVIGFNRDAKVLDNGFRTINTVSEKNALVQRINAEISNEQSKTFPGTNSGAALAEAYNLIVERDKTANVPIIILLTDGKNDFSGDGTTDIRYTYSDGKYVAKKEGSMTAELSNQLMLHVADHAAEEGIRIYTIGLAGKEGVDEKQLRKVAEMTGGVYEEVGSDAADKLPRLFADIFSQRIGSTVIDCDVTKSGDTYTVTLPILNHSVKEANIYLDVTKLDTKTIHLYDAGNTEQNLDPIVVKSGKFWLFKLKNPQVTGEWRLVFSANKNDKEKDLSRAVVVSLLYNYDIDLQITANPNSTVYNKTDKITIRSSFVNADGSPCQDNDLYNRFENEIKDTKKAWYPINVSYQLYRKGDANNSDQMLQGCTGVFSCDTDQHRYETQIDLGTIYASTTDGNLLKASEEYLIRLEVKGAGLSRMYNMTLKLDNKKPEWKVEEVYQVENPEQPDLDDAARSINIELPTKDADGERVVYSNLEPVSDSTGSFELKLEQANGTWYLKGALREDDKGFILDSEGNAQATYNLTAEDVTERSSAVIPITLSAHSRTRGDAHDFTLFVSVDGGDADEIKDGNTAVYSKKQSLHFEATPVEAKDNGNNKVTWTLTTVNDDGSMGVQQSLDDENFGQDIELGTHKGKWKLQADYYYGERLQNTIVYTYEIENHAPEVVPGVAEVMITPTAPKDNAKTIRHNPMFINQWIDGPDTDENGIVEFSVKDLFKEKDNEKLDYSVTVSGDAALATNEDDKMTLTAVGDGDIQLTLTATDEDNEEASTALVIHVVDLTKKWTMLIIIAAAALVALIVLIVIIRQLAKPKWQRYALELWDGEAISRTEKFNLPQGKKNVITFSAFGDDGVFNNQNVNPRSLTNIQAKPERVGSILVRVAKKMQDTRIVAGNVDLRPGKWVSVKLGQEMILMNAGEGGEGVRYRLIDDAITDANEDSFNAYNVSDDSDDSF